MKRGAPPQLIQRNPHTPAKQCRGWRAPFRIEVCRWCVMYRLLGFDVTAISIVTGVSANNVRLILKIFGGKMQRRRNGLGPIIWNGRYAIKRSAHAMLELPDWVPISVGHANGGRELFDGVNMHDLALPPLSWKPKNDGYSDWMSEHWV